MVEAKAAQHGQAEVLDHLPQSQRTMSGSVPTAMSPTAMRILMSGSNVIGVTPNITYSAQESTTRLATTGIWTLPS